MQIAARMQEEQSKEGCAEPKSEMITGGVSSTYMESIHQALGQLIPDPAPLALLDFPNYGNVGDSAIWLGQLAYLRKYRPDCSVVWVSETAMGKWPTLPALPERTVILINGGGNLGDLWPAHQTHRERVIEHYRDHRIIQLPQSIRFQSPESRARCAAAFQSHPDFFILARDRESLDLAKEVNGARTLLSPDMALALGNLKRQSMPRHDCLALLRTDHEGLGFEEASGHSWVNSNWIVADWRDERVTVAQRTDRLFARYPRRTRLLRPLLYKRLATERMQRGCRLLESGRVVITDRLHAHLLCSLLGIPHVVLDNNYRKIARFREVWKTGEGLCVPATSLAEAQELAKGLLSKVGRNPVSSEISG